MFAGFVPELYSSHEEHEVSMSKAAYIFMRHT